MREVALFVEDYAHRQVIGALVERVAGDCSIEVRMDWRSAVGGHGQVVSELEDYMRNLLAQGGPFPDLVIVATDANCRGLNDRLQEIGRWDVPAPVILAVPDPHIERWLLLDGAAFKAVFGKGCDVPDQKCDRRRYKEQLIQAIHASGTIPRLGGIEYADDIVREMDLERVSQLDRSFRRFAMALRNRFRDWQS